MFEKLIHTSRQYLGLPIDTTDSRTVVSHTTQQVDTTLHTVGKNTFNDFLRELVNMREIIIHSTEEGITTDTLISVKADTRGTLYTSMGDLTKYLGIKIYNSNSLTDYLRRNLVKIHFLEK